ncbi:hypothetical protein [Chitinophaga arvensicola]|uniref:Uncharacterized protein n=1 Tax=Chitinophaga arvensicola TaxID=29529 RepID=A0A1I0S7P7_9BACT|nr:hypothetical protein [Chitinophaga arvensicola]SEW51828.1 hypothetical protein SAMN04488122_4522 [Chitinophaga arvensicola]
MQRIGSLLVIVGLSSIVAGFFNHVPKILMWIYKWGEGTAWCIKISLVVAGAVLYLFSGKTQKS